MVSVMSKLELLPNEILLQCFEHLDAINLFHSFDDLNFRFGCLIREIPLHIRLEHVKKCALISFCRRISSDIHVRNGIKSLKISKREKFNASGCFLQSVSLNQLTELQALTFNGSDTETGNQILSTLPFLTKLKYYGEPSSSTSKIFASLPASNIRTLSLKSLDSSVTHAFTSLVNLTVSNCSTEQLCVCFIHSPMLQYVRIESLTNYRDSPRPTDCHAVYLKRLSIKTLQQEFNSVETLLQRTPNLKTLIINSSAIDELVDACRWQHLITSFLPNLNNFQFKFRIGLKDKNDAVVDKFLQFQTDFWHQQHHWFTEYALNKNEGYIYTVPYVPNEFDITQDTKRYYNELNNNVETFANVTDLTLNFDVVNYTGKYYFSNVKSLRLTYDRVHNFHPKETKQIEYLKRMVNLNSITHLEISSKSQWNSPSMMLQILKETVHLSSLKIDQVWLKVLYTCPELCSHLAKMIKKLDFRSATFQVFDFWKTETICQTFSNLEEFHCDIRDSDDLTEVLLRLSKLFFILSKLLYFRLFSFKTNYVETATRHNWLEGQKLKFGSLIFFIEWECRDFPFASYGTSRSCDTTHINPADTTHIISFDATRYRPARRFGSRRRFRRCRGRNGFFRPRTRTHCRHD